MYNPIRNANLATLFFHTATKFTKMFNITQFFLSIGYNRGYTTGGCENY